MEGPGALGQLLSGQAAGGCAEIQRDPSAGAAPGGDGVGGEGPFGGGAFPGAAPGSSPVGF